MERALDPKSTLERERSCGFKVYYETRSHSSLELIGGDKKTIARIIV